MTIPHTLEHHTLHLPNNEPLTYDTIGSGPGLVVIHGTARQANDYVPLAQQLASHFTVHLLNRRGRGGSTAQGPHFSLDQERDDVIALLEATQSPYLFGHSFGGLVALRVALAYKKLEKLAVYEPALSIDGSITIDWLPDFERALRAADYVAAETIFLKGMGGSTMPAEQLTALAEAIVHSPMWPAMQQLLPTLAPEVRAAHGADNMEAMFQDITIPTLLLTGTAGDNIASQRLDRRKRAIDALAAIIPKNTFKELPGLGHNAPDMDAPEIIAQALTDYFLN